MDLIGLNMIRDIINGIFTSIFLIPAFTVIILKYIKKQYVRVECDIRSAPKQLARKIKRRKR
jgi:hypothetical protein